MRLLVVASLLYFAVVVTGNYRSKFNYPKFQVGNTHWYDVNINFTAKIPGFRPQVSKRTLSLELKIYAETENNLIIAMQNILDSKSHASVGSDAELIPTWWRKDMEESMVVPFKCVYQDGEVKSYYLNTRDSLEIQKIRRSVLRNLEVYIDPKALNLDIEESLPITYNVTKASPAGNYTVHYAVISSPYNRVPAHLNVYNISRVDNYEVVPYPAYESHSNFMAQGCPKVCRRNNIENEFDAGCPVGYESYHTLMKKSYVQNYGMRAVQDGSLMIDNIRTSETHVAHVYDQNMEISIESSFRFKKVTDEKLSQHKGQKEFKNLNDFTTEINENEINHLCGSPNSKSAIDTAKKLLLEVSNIVIKTDLDQVNTSTNVGEKLLLLRKALNVLKEGDFRLIQESIVGYDKLGNASEVDKIKRQIWMDILPLVGTTDSIDFITNIIQENMNVLHKAISLWEASSMLNALPSNILHVDDHVIHLLNKLRDLISNHQQPGYRIFFSAAHIAVARTINKMCSRRRNVKDKVELESDSLNSIPGRFRASNEEINSNHLVCKSTIVQGAFRSMAQELDTTADKAKRAIYIEALSRTGLSEALPVLAPYISGKIKGLSPNYVEYLKVATLKSLHALVISYPREVQILVKPVFFNQSESFSVRIAAFAVLIRTNPSLGLLQQVVAETWTEKSGEVGSYVLSALETYGNASLPCSQLLAHRIKKVFPQAKRFDLGYHRSKSLMWSIFDDIREFGLANYLQYSASNQSIIPSTIYGALEYNVDSFRDFLFQYSTHIQGKSASSIYDNILKHLNIKVGEPIPNTTTHHLFEKVNFTDREPDAWKMSLYHKIFYTVSYNYFDGEAATIQDALDIVSDHLIRHLKPDPQGNFEGRLVKLYLPSSYRTSAVGHSFPARIQFEMENPLLVSLKFHIKQEIKTQTKYTFSVEPSVYAATLYTSQLLNLGDCKNIGVYYERKSTLNLPFEIQLSTEFPNKLNASYRFPHLSRMIFTYRSEAGTYAGAGNLTSLPLNEKKVPIRTMPTFFKRERNLSMTGFPPFSASILTEDFLEENEKVPKKPKEAMNYFIRKCLNSGWRSKFVEIKWMPIKGIWSNDTAISIKTSMDRTVTNQWVYQKTSIEQLVRELEMDYISERDTLESIAQEALILYNALVEGDVHIQDTWSVNISHVVKGKLLSWLNYKGTHLYTVDRTLQVFRGQYAAQLHNIKNPIQGAVKCLSVFLGQPNIFRYGDSSFDKHEGLVICGINFDSPSFDHVHWGIKAIMGYRPINEILNKESSKPVHSNYFLPETHAECLKDVKDGKSASIPCLKALRERTKFNFLRDFEVIINGSHKHLTLLNYVNQLGFPVNYLFEERIENLKGFLGTSLRINGVYIDKLTAHPFYDLVVNRKNQTTKHRFLTSFLTEPFSSFETNTDTYLYRATNNSYPASCTLAEKYVFTYDLENYQLPDKTNSCTYLLSAHCMKNKKFAVLVSTDFTAHKSKEIYLYVGNDTIILTSTKESSFKLIFNGKDQVLTPKTPVALNNGDIVANYLLDVENMRNILLHVKAYRAGLNIFYNGIQVQIRVSSRYKGELCGLCGDFDGDDHKDFRGLNGKFYDDTREDFIQSFNLGNCSRPKPPIIKHRHVCGEDASMAGENQDSGCILGAGEPTRLIKRNLVLSREDQFCFSLKPLLTCDGDSQPSETEEEDVEFKCFPRNDPDTRNKVKEARVRILRELNDEDSDLIETVSVAKTCSDNEG